MAQQNRILHSNVIRENGIVLTPSSEAITFPAAFLTDQLRQKPWRTDTGWTIITGFNDRLPFERPPGTPHVAQVAAGHYLTGASLAVAVEAAMDVADAGPDWTVSYGVAAANKFRITNTGAPVNFNLMWTDVGESGQLIGRDLGFQITTDDTGTFTYTADFAAYQSRHYLKIHRTTETSILATAAVLLDHNFGALSGVGAHQAIKIQANDVDTTAGWLSPSTSTSIAGLATDNPRLSLAVLDSRVWWRLLIEDVGNSAGYIELGKFYLGAAVTPLINVSDRLVNSPEDFSSDETGIDGTHFSDWHRRRDRWSLSYHDMNEQTRAVLDTFEADTPVGKNFYFVWDADNASGHGNGIEGTTYGYLAAPFTQTYVPGIYWTYGAPFFEAL